jgi:hypothetical protein
MRHLFQLANGSLKHTIHSVAIHALAIAIERVLGVNFLAALASAILLWSVLTLAIDGSSRPLVISACSRLLTVTISTFSAPHIIRLDLGQSGESAPAAARGSP